ncbi:MAG: hypothetical protein JKY61_09940 [Planctomycetes bacterium]|nr:hypothetical protein [Planctomycetota bacterium]
MLNFRPLLGLSLLALLFSAPALSQGSAESLGEGVRLLDPNPIVWGYNGSQTAISGRWMFVASGHGGTPSIPYSGKVMVYRRTADGFSLFQEIFPASPRNGEQFGWFSMKASGDVLVVCSENYPAQLLGTGRTVVYRFDGTTWALDANLLSPYAAGPPYRWFGTRAAISGDDLVVGAVGLGDALPDGSQSWRGGFHYYHYFQGQWQLQQIWEPAANASSNHKGYGGTLELDGTTLYCGSGGYSRPLLMELDPVSKQFHVVRELFSPIPGVSPFYTYSVAIDEPWMAIGMSYRDGGYVGSVSLYEKTSTGWIFREVLQDDNPSGLFDAFGFSLALKGERLLVGAISAGDVRQHHKAEGVSYLFERDFQGQWKEQYSIHPPDRHAAYDFGWSGALGDGVVIVGDRYYHDGANPNGGAFAFEFPIGADVCSGVVNSTGQPGQIRALGTTIAAEGNLRMQAVNLPANQAGYFLASRQTGFFPNSGGSLGTLCLAGSILRLNTPAHLGLSGADGRRTIQLDPAAFPSPGHPPILSGQTWIFQYWYRDNQPTPATNFTGATAVMFH